VLLDLRSLEEIAGAAVVPTSQSGGDSDGAMPRLVHVVDRRRPAQPRTHTVRVPRLSADDVAAYLAGEFEPDEEEDLVLVLALSV